MAPIDLIRAWSLTNSRAALTAYSIALANKPVSGINRTLDSFDFTFNPKMNRSLVFDLATGAFIDRREDALFLGPSSRGQESSGTSHRPRSHLTGLTRALSRDACPTRGTRRGRPRRHAETVHGIRYEHASTLLTSNRSVENWGKLLADAAAARAIPTAGSIMPRAQVRPV